MTIAVDFDGTIVTHAYPSIGREIPGAIDTLRHLQADGHTLILWTVREGKLLEEALEYCRNRGLDFYAANEHYTDEPAQKANSSLKSCRKLTADLYIDDRNFGGFPGWNTIYKAISRQHAHDSYICRLSTHKSMWERIFG